MNAPSSDNVNVSFILGPGRSGTALMMWILNMHPRCTALPEVKHVIHFYRKYHNIQIVSKELIRELELYFTKKNSPDKLKLVSFNSGAFFSEIKEGRTINYSELCRKIYTNYSTFLHPGKISPVVIDKNPLYTTRVNDLARLFPEAKFLFMIRDYRSYVLSSYENYAKRNKIYSAHLYSFFWINHMLLIKKNLKVRPEKCMVLRYEDFISDPGASVKKSCELFGLNYTEDLLNYYKAFEQRLPELEVRIADRRIKKLRQLSKPINPNRMSSWQNGLSKAQVKRIEFWCSRIGETFNYHPSVKLNVLEKTLYFIEGFPLYVLLRIYFRLAVYGFFSKRKKRK